MLEWLLKMPVSTAEDVFAAFRQLPGAVESTPAAEAAYAVKLTLAE